MTLTVRPADDLVLGLQQAAVWVARGDQGRLVTRRLDDLPHAHVVAILAWLRARALDLHDRQHADLVGLVARGRQPDDVMRLVAAHSRHDPHVWLEETPLVRRLVQLAGPPPKTERRRRFLPARLRR